VAIGVQSLEVTPEPRQQAVVLARAVHQRVAQENDPLGRRRFRRLGGKLTEGRRAGGGAHGESQQGKTSQRLRVG
jgi:hypothetical protein